MDASTSAPQWVVGYFEAENKFSVIPINWINKSNTDNVYYCKWPSSGQVTSKMILKRVQPGRKWISYPVKIIERFDTYEAAASKEVQLFLSNSAEESDASDHNNDDGDGSSTDSEEPCIQVFKKQKLSDTVTEHQHYNPKVFSNNCISSALKILNSVEEQLPLANDSEITEFETPQNIDTQINKNSEALNCNSNNLNNTTPKNYLNIETNVGHILATDNSFIPNSSAHLGLDNDFDLNRYITTGSTEGNENHIETNFNKMYMYLNRIDKKMDFVIDSIKKQNTNPYLLKAVDTIFLGNFPMKDVLALQNVEEVLKVDENKAKLANLITSIGGTNVKNFVKRVLSKLFSNQLSSHCSWTGFKNNYRLDNLQIIKTMQSVSYELYNNDEITFEILVKDWFRHGTQRHRRDINTADSSQKEKDHRDNVPTPFSKNN